MSHFSPNQLLLFGCCVQLFGTPWTIAHQTPLSSTISQSLLRCMSIESVMLSNHPILFCPLLLLPSIFLSIRVFSNESALRIRWPKHWSFSYNPSNEYLWLISFITIIFITSTIVWPQVNSRGGTQLNPSTENCIKDLLSMAPTIRTRPSFPLSQSPPSGSLHKPLIFLHQRPDRLKTTITGN